MVKRASTPTRVGGDVAAAAADVAASENRSIAEQITHWARIGMHVERAGSTGHRRVLDAIAGRGQFRELTRDERTLAHGQVDARIAELAAAQSFGSAERAATGHATVSFEDGTLVEIAPDGTRRPL